MNLEKTETMLRLVDASVGTMFRLKIESEVGKHFKSTRYLTVRRLVDGIVLNILLNDKITPTSADQALACVQSRSRSFYLSIAYDYNNIKNDFLKYAATVVDDLNEIIALDLREVNFVTYILSLDIARRHKFNRDEIIKRTFSYRELLDLRNND